MAVLINSEGFLVEQGTDKFVDYSGNYVQVPIKATDEQIQKAREASMFTPTKEKEPEPVVFASKESFNSAVAEAVKEALKTINIKTEQQYSLKDFGAVIKEAIGQSQGQSKRVLSRLPINADEIPLDDYLEKPVEFYIYSQMYTIYDDVRKGHPVFPPYGRIIKFHNLFRSKKSTASNRYDGGTIAIAFARVFSKKQVEWMRAHSDYGIKFFETVEQAKNVSILFAQMLKEADNQVGRTDFDVINKAKELSIPLSHDTSILRQQVVFKIAEIKMNAEKQRAYVPTSTFTAKESPAPAQSY